MHVSTIKSLTSGIPGSRIILFPTVIKLSGLLAGFTLGRLPTLFEGLSPLVETR